MKMLKIFAVALAVGCCAGAHAEMGGAQQSAAQTNASASTAAAGAQGQQTSAQAGSKSQLNLTAAQLQNLQSNQAFQNVWACFKPTTQTKLATYFNVQTQAKTWTKGQCNDKTVNCTTVLTALGLNSKKHCPLQFKKGEWKAAKAYVLKQIGSASGS